MKSDHMLVDIPIFFKDLIIPCLENVDQVVLTTCMILHLGSIFR